MSNEEILEVATMEELAECQKELEETQEDLTAQIKENAQLSAQLDAAQQRILRLEGILTTGALAFRGMQ